MSRSCTRCGETLPDPALFCPNCGWPALSGEFQWNVPDADQSSSMPVVGLRLWDRAPNPFALDVVVRGAGQELERVQIEALGRGSAGQAALPNLALASSSPDVFSLYVEHPMASGAVHPLLRQVFTPGAPDLIALGALPLSVFTQDGDGWVAHVAIRNSGGAVRLSEASIRIAGMGYEGPLSALNNDHLTGGLLAKGETASVPVRLDGRIFDQLAKSPTLARGARLVLDSVNIPLLIVDGARPAIELHLRDTENAGLPFVGAGIAGRKARIGVALENRSAEIVRVTAVSVRRKGGDWVDIDAPRRWRLGGVDPGRISAAELRPQLKEDFGEEGKHLPAGPIELEAKVRARTVDSGVDIEASAKFQMQINHPEPFAGRIGIDFGTTETAAAVSMISDDPEALPIEPPLVLELGPLGLTADQVRLLSPGGDHADVANPIHATRFLETTLALDRDGKWSIGEDIPDLTEGREVLLFSRFKWLADEKPPAQQLANARAILKAWEAGERKIPERVDPRLLLGVFLTEVRKLIEEHPDVAGVCEVTAKKAGSSRCKVYATRPVTMGPRMERAFLDGLSDAGFSQVSVSRLADVFTPESWPPALMVTEGRNEVFAPLTLSDAGLYREPVAEGPALSRVLVIDVGGGSADLSAIGVQVGRLSTTISILGNDMSRRFTGDGFERTIGEALKANLNKEADWPERAPPEVQKEFHETVKWLQHSGGPLQGLVNADVLFQSGGRTLEGVEQMIRVALNDRDRATAMEILFNRRPRTKQFELDLDQFPALAARIERRFYETYWNHLGEKIDALKPYLEGEATNGKVRLVISGRGAACPLADVLIRRLTTQKLKNPGEVIFLTPPVSKSITSWGALRLADHIASIRGHVLKHPDEMEGFSVLTGADSSQRPVLEPMKCCKIWLYQAEGRAIRSIDERPDLGAPVSVESIALIQAAEIPANVPQASIYSGRNTEDWRPKVEARLDLLKEVPREHQWVCVRRDGHKLVKEIKVAEGEAAALEAILADLQ